MLRLRLEPAESLDDVLKVLGPHGGHPPCEAGEVGVEPLDVVDGKHEPLELVAAYERVQLRFEEGEVQPLHLRPLLREQLVAFEGIFFARVIVLPESIESESFQLRVVVLGSGLQFTYSAVQLSL